MPGHSGLDFVENQRAKGCKIPNFALASGSWSPPQLERAAALGARVFEKPFDLEQLVGWVRECAVSTESDRVLDSWFESWAKEAD
jgi:CheY-like chemotaxis protein